MILDSDPTIVAVCDDGGSDADLVVGQPLNPDRGRLGGNPWRPGRRWAYPSTGPFYCWACVGDLTSPEALEQLVPPAGLESILDSPELVGVFAVARCGLGATKPIAEAVAAHDRLLPPGARPVRSQTVFFRNTTFMTYIAWTSQS